ncbi:MAG: MoaD family protein [Candidatus Heimdallarchaeaceae archaeon]
MYAKLRQIAQKELFVDVKTVEELLKLLIEEYGTELKNELLLEDGTLASYYKILVNGRNINVLAKEHTKLKPGDFVVIIPAIGGG